MTNDPDLHALAAEAILAAEPWVRYNPTEMLADAVLAAVLRALPESLICDAIVNPSVFLGRARRESESYPAWAARAVVVALQGLAATAPPAPPSSTVEPENGPAVPEATERRSAGCDELRRLVAVARRILDQVAETEAIQNADEDLAKRAADLAQRIVDEIGHPVTDEPALGPSYREQITALIAERDRLAETIRRYEPVIEAAKAWHAAGWNTRAGGPAQVLSNAIEALGDIPDPDESQPMFGKVTAEDMRLAAWVTGGGIRSVDLEVEFEDEDEDDAPATYREATNFAGLLMLHSCGRSMAAFDRPPPRGGTCPTCQVAGQWRQLYLRDNPGQP